MTNAGVRKEAIGLPTNVSRKAFLSGEPKVYLGDSVCMVGQRKQVGTDTVKSVMPRRCRKSKVEEITTCPLMQPISDRTSRIPPDQ